jgi:hypothetical protein
VDEPTGFDQIAERFGPIPDEKRQQKPRQKKTGQVVHGQAQLADAGIVDEDVETVVVTLHRLCQRADLGELP